MPVANEGYFKELPLLLFCSDRGRGTISGWHLVLFWHISPSGKAPAPSLLFLAFEGFGGGGVVPGWGLRLGWEDTRTLPSEKPWSRAVGRQGCILRGLNSRERALVASLGMSQHAGAHRKLEANPLYSIRDYDSGLFLPLAPVIHLAQPDSSDQSRLTGLGSLWPKSQYITALCSQQWRIQGFFSSPFPAKAAAGAGERCTPGPHAGEGTGDRQSRRGLVGAPWRAGAANRR